MTGVHAAVVLAAGGSTRLGRPKQLLMRDGETLVRRAVRLARETGPARLVVVAGAHAGAVAMHAGDGEIAVNAGWEEGLGSSLRVAAAVLEGFAGPVLLLGCDQPALQAEHLGSLLAGAARSGSGAAACCYADVIGMPAVVPSAWLLAETFGGDRGLGARLRALPDGALRRCDAPELGFDVDTEADVARAVERGLLEP